MHGLQQCKKYTSHLPASVEVMYTVVVVVLLLLLLFPFSRQQRQQLGLPFSYTNETVADIKARNPTLNNTDFVMVRGTFGNTSANTTTGIAHRPYPIIQTTLIGPYSQLPLNHEVRNYSLIEWTPLYVGAAHTRVIGYKGVNKTVGGYIEPFAFNMYSRKSKG